jgi:hypothetical protein
MEAFLPFWIRAGGRAPTEEEFARGEQGAQIALEIAERLGDATLSSAALDGVGTIAQMRGDLDGMRIASQRRLDMGDRLPISERIDAACMIAWAAMSVGDLDGADAVAGSALALVQPGQAANWALHLAAWRTLVAAARGDWDVALAAANRAFGFWIELDRVPAGYAVRGFLAALDIARARRDESGEAHWREVVEPIVSAFTPSRGRRVQAAHAAGDPAAMVAALEAIPAVTWLDDSLERSLGYLSDRRVFLDNALLDRLEATTFPSARLVHAQLDRARGLARDDAGLLRAALATYETAGARPAEARVRCELGRLTGDPGLFEAGAQILRSIGDVDQLDRYG